MENQENPIRILCVVSTLDRGGAESMVMSLYRNIDRTQIQFDFVKHTTSRGAFEDEIESLGGRIFASPRYKIYNHIQYIYWWNCFFNLHPEYKIIHGHFFTISSIYLHIAQKKGLYTIGHSHCTQEDNNVSLLKKIKTLIENYFFINKIENYADFCFACSQEAGKWIFKNKPFWVLNNAIDSRKFIYNQEIRQQVRKELGIEDDILILGTVGRVMHQKNPEGIVKIFDEVHKRNSKSKLIWVGNGPLLGNIKEQLNNLQLLSDVIFTGIRKDVNRILQAMDVFIFPSYYEGLGVVTIEAQAAGLPTFCSEAVPREAGITECCHFLPLGNYGKWADMILETHFIRRDMYNEIINAGYDVHETAKYLQEFYLRNWK